MGFAMETECVYCAVHTKCLLCGTYRVFTVRYIPSVYCAVHTECLLCGTYRVFTVRYTPSVYIQFRLLLSLQNHGTLHTFT